MPDFDIDDAKKEVQEKTIEEIEIETSFKWASRALGCYELYEETKLAKWYIQAVEYRNEAIEHAAMAMDDGKTLKTIQDEMDKCRPMIDEKTKIGSALIELADNLDKVGAKTGADIADKIIVLATDPTKFDSDEFAHMFETPTGELPVMRTLTQVPEEFEVLPAKTTTEPQRLDEIRRRDELMKLKELIDYDDGNNELDLAGLDEGDESLLDHMGSLEKEEDFEDGEADDELLKKQFDEDEPGTLDKVMSFLRENPEMLEKLLMYLV